MKETICTIPINDIFMEKKGCPFCRMYDMLENQYATFCKKHFEKITEVGKRLPNALILQTHLQSVLDNYFPRNTHSKPDRKKLAALDEMLHTCYICDRIQNDVEHFLRTVFKEWETNPEFRKLYQEQEFICLEHYKEVSLISLKGVPSKHLANFHEDTANLAKKQLELLISDTTHFCNMFDYRNRDADWGSSRDAIERDLRFLAGIPMPEENKTEE